MGWVKQVFLRCDKCYEVLGESDPGRSGMTVAEQRKSARMDGWAIRPGSDICEECNAKAGEE